MFHGLNVNGVSDVVNDYILKSEGPNPKSEGNPKFEIRG